MSLKLLSGLHFWMAPFSAMSLYKLEEIMTHSVKCEAIRGCI